MSRPSVTIEHGVYVATVTENLYGEPIVSSMTGVGIVGNSNSASDLVTYAEFCNLVAACIRTWGKK